MSNIFNFYFISIFIIPDPCIHHCVLLSLNINYSLDNSNHSMVHLQIKNYFKDNFLYLSIKGFDHFCKTGDFIILKC